MTKWGVRFFRNCFICLICSRPRTNSRGFRLRILVFHIQNHFLSDFWESLLNFELWQFTCMCDLMFTSTQKRKYNYIMWEIHDVIISWERGTAQGTRSPSQFPHRTSGEMGGYLKHLPLPSSLTGTLRKQAFGNTQDFLLEKVKK